MEDKQIAILWAFLASVAAVVLFFAWSNSDRKWDAVMGKNADYTIEDVIEESEENDKYTQRIVEEYNQLSENGQRECDIVRDYFGDEPGDLCLDTVFDGVETDYSGGDLNSDARESMRTQIEEALNPPSSE